MSTTQHIALTAGAQRAAIAVVALTAYELGERLDVSPDPDCFDAVRATLARIADLSRVADLLAGGRLDVDTARTMLPRITKDRDDHLRMARGSIEHRQLWRDGDAGWGYRDLTPAETEAQYAKDIDEDLGRYADHAELIRVIDEALPGLVAV